jgi:hypothetical protein
VRNSISMPLILSVIRLNLGVAIRVYGCIDFGPLGPLAPLPDLLAVRLVIKNRV